jgi:hypothetical protein
MATGCLYYKRQDGVIVPIVGAASDHGLLAGLGDNDHPQYQLVSEKAAANGYASLDSGGKVPVAQLPDLGQGLVGMGYAAATAQLTPTTTTMADVVGATITFNCVAGDRVIIWGNFQCAVTANNGVVVGAINIAGGDAGKLGQMGQAGSVAPQGGGFTLTENYTHSGATANVTFKLRGRMGAGGSASAANINTNTTINALQFRR